MKLSGLGMFVAKVDVVVVSQVIEDLLQIVGVERCTYGSNFSIEKLWADYRTMSCGLPC